MNKTKLVLPLLVAPMLFACGGGSVAGDYKVQEASKIVYTFTKGDEEEFKKSDFTQISEIQTAIHDVLTQYSDKTPTKNGAVCLNGDMGVEVLTVNEGKTTVYPVNLRETGPSTMDMAFQYGKTASGYHFFGNYAQGYDNYEVFYHISNDFGNRKEEIVVDNGFEVNGKTLTAHFVGRFIKESDREREVDYQIEFTVTATK
ncbi:MAG: hypothetical protein MJ207_03245 [Bacilli bacterium]|nr:hypothetical protein [Bacilli bacterium]